MARAPAKTHQVFHQRKEPDSRTLTSERIADHLAAFQSAGGCIEVLGATRVLKKLDGVATAPAAPSLASKRPGTT